MTMKFGMTQHLNESGAPSNHGFGMLDSIQQEIPVSQLIAKAIIINDSKHRTGANNRHYSAK